MKWTFVFPDKYVLFCIRVFSTICEMCFHAFTIIVADCGELVSNVFLPSTFVKRAIIIIQLFQQRNTQFYFNILLNLKRIYNA